MLTLEKALKLCLTFHCRTCFLRDPSVFSWRVLLERDLTLEVELQSAFRGGICSYHRGLSNHRLIVKLKGD